MKSILSVSIIGWLIHITECQIISSNSFENKTTDNSDFVTRYYKLHQPGKSISSFNEAFLKAGGVLQFPESKKAISHITKVNFQHNNRYLPNVYGENNSIDELHEDHEYYDLHDEDVNSICPEDDIAYQFQFIFCNPNTFWVYICVIVHWMMMCYIIKSVISTDDFVLRFFTKKK